MSELPAPRAPRLRKPGLRDPRLIVGVAVLALSGALGAYVVEEAGSTIAVYAADTDIVAGQGVDLADLRVVEVGGALDTDHYLSPTSATEAAAWVAIRSVGEGELVPRTALSTEAALDLRPVTVHLGPLAPTTLEVGDMVDVWRLGSSDDLAPAPTLIGSDMSVASVEQTTGFGTQDSVRVELMVPSADLPIMLAAAQNSQLTVVKVPGS